MLLLLVMIGGAIGAALRYQAGRLFMHMLGTGMPWGTWFVNITGGLFMGLLAGLLARFGGASGETWRVLVGVGVLGGYTTFSSFSLETVMMIERGAWGPAILYVTTSAVGAILALFAGLWITRMLPA